jgi:hypothetical protein
MFSGGGTLSLVQNPVIVLVKLGDQLDPLPASGTSPAPAVASAAIPSSGIGRRPFGATARSGRPATPERLPGGFTLFLIQLAVLVFIKALKNLFTLRFAVRAFATSRSVGGLCSETGIRRGHEAKREN